MYIRRVHGNSMLPTLKPGQIVLARKFRRSIKQGDVIIFRHNELEKIKRVRRVTPVGVMVAGDNPSESTDSRQFGVVLYQDITAKVVIPKC